MGKNNSWLIVALFGIFLGCEQGDVESDKGKESYTIGYQMGSDLKQRGLEVSVKSLVDGIREGYEGRAAKISNEEIAAAGQRIQKKVVAGLEARAKENLEKGRKFLEENKRRPGVIALASGLQYQVLLEGTGPIAKENQPVKVHYVGTLMDGQKFDSSYDRNQPAVVKTKEVIQGWKEALKLMKAGSKWRLVIPPELAYGNQAQPGIPPFSVLVFEVDLLEVLPLQPDGKPEGK